MSSRLYWLAKLFDRQVMKHPAGSPRKHVALQPQTTVGQDWSRQSPDTVVSCSRKFIADAAVGGSAPQRSGTPGGSEDIGQPESQQQRSFNEKNDVQRSGELS